MSDLPRSRATAEPDEFAPIEDDGWNTDERCPWCKKYIDDLYELADKVFDCPHCEKPVDCSTWLQYVLVKVKS